VLLRVSLFCAAALSCDAQFFELATTADGSQVYFTSPLVLKGTKNGATRKLFMQDSSGIRLLAENPYMSRGLQTFGGISAPGVSDDGAVLVFTLNASCSGGSSCLFFERYRPAILVHGQPVSTGPVGGTVQVSPNGRYVLKAGGTGISDGTAIGDLSTLTEAKVNGSPPPGRVISNGGVALLAQADGALVLARPGSSMSAGNLRPANSFAGLDAAGTEVIYESTGGYPVQTTELLRLDLRTRSETALTALGSAAVDFTISDDGSEVLFPFVQLLLLPVTGGSGRVLSADSPLNGATRLSGSGNAVFATTSEGRLIRVDTASGDVQEWISKTPVTDAFVNAAGGANPPPTFIPALVPGSSVCMSIEGGWNADSEVLLGGNPVKVTSKCFQVPWDTTSPASVEVRFHAVASPFEQWGIGKVSPALMMLQHGPNYVVAFHQNFDSLISPSEGASPGEIIHMYATGLGPVDPPVSTGAAAPNVPLSRTVNPVTCDLNDGITVTQAAVLFSGLAPGYAGWYQIDLQIPAGLHRLASLACYVSGTTDRVLLPLAP